MPTRVTLSRAAEKDVLRVPHHVVLKLNGWIRLVETRGLQEARKIPGSHDEPLKGPRHGQRSIRLSRAYRAVYVVSSSGDLVLVTIEEVMKHEY